MKQIFLLEKEDIRQLHSPEGLTVILNGQEIQMQAMGRVVKEPTNGDARKPKRRHYTRSKKVRSRGELLTLILEILDIHPGLTAHEVSKRIGIHNSAIYVVMNKNPEKFRREGSKIFLVGSDK